MLPLCAAMRAMRTCGRMPMRITGDDMMLMPWWVPC
jgi:hypothetical protein